MGNARNLGSLLNTSSTIQADDLNIGQLGNRNLIINGAMQVAQRGTSSTSTGFQTVDRFRVNLSGGFTVSQSTDAPDGFSKSLKVEVTSTATPASNSANYFQQPIEGLNTYSLGFGTANAKTVTISFWVKSSIAGQYSVALDNGSATRCFAQAYTVNATNTWEYKTITISGDTTGTWATDNTSGIRLFFGFGAGVDRREPSGSWTSNIAFGADGDVILTETLNATFQITGVQLEVGDTATPFEHRSYAQELQLCQRYYQRFDSANQLSFPLVQIWWNGTNAGLAAVRFSPPMRAAPSFTSSNVKTWSPGGSSLDLDSLVQTSATPTLSRLDAITVTSPFTPGQSTFLQAGPVTGSGVMEFDAEL